MPSKPRPLLNHTQLDANQRALFESARTSPVKILQIGEGNFLRGFFDWMVHTCRKQGLYDGSIVVTQPRPAGAQKLADLRRQEGLYTLLTRGLEQGKLVEQSEVISVFSDAVDPYATWSEFLSLAENPHLEVVVSNTTEAGLVYMPTPFTGDQPLVSFPARLTAFLFRRFSHFEGAADKGLVLLPCELLEHNGDLLRTGVLRHSADWGLPDEFVAWVKHHNRFLNSLVDRIVTGYPTDEAAQLFADWGYEDAFLNTAEPYHFWAIEGDERLAKLLPFQQAGLNVHWVEDLEPYHVRKVRILNGAHTLMTPLGLLRGFHHVREIMEDTRLRRFVQTAIEGEIMPVLALDAEELQAYADTVFERFGNPFIQHRLLDIAMNSISKFRVRLLPSLLDFQTKTGALPTHIVEALAALVRLYKCRQTEAGYVGARLNGEIYPLRDEPAVLQFFATLWSRHDTKEISLDEVGVHTLANVELWGTDLTQVDGLADLLGKHLAKYQ